MDNEMLLKKVIKSTTGSDTKGLIKNFLLVDFKNKYKANILNNGLTKCLYSKNAQLIILATMEMGTYELLANIDISHSTEDELSFLAECFGTHNFISPMWFKVPNLSYDQVLWLGKNVDNSFFWRKIKDSINFENLTLEQLAELGNQPNTQHLVGNILKIMLSKIPGPEMNKFALKMQATIGIGVYCDREKAFHKNQPSR